jgi:hypothetical protein
MEKDKLNETQCDGNRDLKREANTDVLEISSTGYGLESVTKTDESNFKSNPPNCGGL